MLKVSETEDESKGFDFGGTSSEGKKEEGTLFSAQNGIDFILTMCSFFNLLRGTGGRGQFAHASHVEPSMISDKLKLPLILMENNDNI
jgi:hypothetical protein